MPGDRAPARRGPREAAGRVGDGGPGMSAATRVLSTLMVVIGIAIVIRTVAGGGGAVAFGILIGLLFVAAGAGRLYAERRR